MLFRSSGQTVIYDAGLNKWVNIAIGPDGSYIPNLDEVTTVGNITQNGIQVSSVTFSNGTRLGTNSDSNIEIVGNLLPAGTSYTIGSPTNYWANAWFGPQSITILPEQVTGTVIVLQNDNGYLGVQGGGFAVISADGSYQSFYVDNPTGRSTFQAPIAQGQAVEIGRAHV